MDKARIANTARKHVEQLEAARKAASNRTGPKPGAVFDSQFPALMEALDQASREYCAAYNSVFGYEKLVIENNDSNINIDAPDVESSHGNLQFDPLCREVCYCGVIVRRGERERLAISVAEHGSTLTLMFEGNPISPEEAITLLLDKFTAKLTAAECAQI